MSLVELDLGQALESEETLDSISPVPSSVILGGASNLRQGQLGVGKLPPGPRGGWSGVGRPCVFGCQGCDHKVPPQNGGLQQQRLIFSYFWKLEVHDQGAGFS